MDRLLEGFIDHVLAEWPPPPESQVLDAVTSAATVRCATSCTNALRRRRLTTSKTIFDVPRAARMRGRFGNPVDGPSLLDSDQPRLWLDRNTIHLLVDRDDSARPEAWNLLAVPCRDERFGGEA